MKRLFFKGFLLACLVPQFLEAQSGLEVEALVMRPGVSSSLRSFYQAREFQPYWMAGEKPKREAELYLKYLKYASLHGLTAELYRLAHLEKLKDQATSRDSGGRGTAPGLEFELAMTESFLDYARDLSQGRIHSREVAAEWLSVPRKIDLATTLQNEKLNDVLESLPPPHQDYEKLQEALSRYRVLESNGGWESVAGKEKLELGSTGPRVGLLRQRLAATGDLSGSASRSSSDIFDESVEAAVKRFQSRHGLEADGRVGGQTLNELNVSASERVRQIEVNLEKWRWLPGQLGDRYLWVNVPQYELMFYDRGKNLKTMRVVVGKKDWRTPIFSDQVEHLILNPRWNVPSSIMREEILPEIMGDPEYLKKKNMKVLVGSGTEAKVVDPASIDWQALDPTTAEIRFRQESGLGNALGLVKFIFPNRFNVYLHDTPSKGYFSLSRRALSHGCVRVQNPFDLALLVLRDDPRGNMDFLEKTLAKKTETFLPLQEPLPIYINYFTAWVDDDGLMHFREDVYGYDRKMGQLLDALSRKRSKNL